MKIGIIGTGNVGSALGKGWASQGHKVVFGTRQPEGEKVQKLLAEVGEGVTAVPIPDAIQQSDIIVLATPWNAASDVAHAVTNWRGKIVIDATNPIAPGLQLAVGHTTSAAEQLATFLPGASVVKAFNTTGAENMLDPLYDGDPITMFICGDDADAKNTVTELAETLGFDVADVGGLEAARLIEPMAMVWITLAMKQGLGRNIAFKLVRR
ncbi:MAG: NADPH-dependent F420 reductase [Anaerolineaceae bacterium]|nr:NADPH-dependent F420 reductase [Anaerolineaceae bacterium]